MPPGCLPVSVTLSSRLQVKHRLEVEVKISADGRVVTKGTVGREPLGHTEWSLQIFDKSRPGDFQSLDVLHTVQIWRGQDKHKYILRNTERLIESMHQVQERGFLFRVPNLQKLQQKRNEADDVADHPPRPALPTHEDVVRVDVIFKLGGDMSFQDSFLGVGGLHDPDSMCALCNTPAGKRWDYYEWVTTPEDLTVGQLSDKYGMYSLDIHDLNTQDTLNRRKHLDLFTLGRHPNTASDKPKKRQSSTVGASVAKGKRRMAGSSANSRPALPKAAFSSPTSSHRKAPSAESPSSHSKAPSAESPGTRSRQEWLDQTKKAVEVIPVSDWDRGDSTLTLPAGTVLRVVTQRKDMDRVTPKALFPFPKWHCIFCCLHALMRVSECFFQALQDRATTHDLVDQLNQLLISFNCGYLIRPKTDSQASSKSADDEYRPPKFNGNPARKIMANISAIIDKLFPTPDEVDESHASEVALSNRFRLMWTSWVTVYNIISAPLPTDSQIRNAGKEVRRLVWRMSNFQQPGTLTSLYLHTLLCHLEELLEKNGSIGQYNQTSVEANHKRQVSAWQRMGGGGVQGAKRIGKGLRRELGCPVPRQDFAAGITMDPAGEHVAGKNALTRLFPPDEFEDTWRHNYGEFQLMQCASALNLLRGLPFCGLHKAFVCECDLLQRSNRWQRLAKIGRPGDKRDPSATNNAMHDDQEPEQDQERAQSPATPTPTTTPPSQAPTSRNNQDVPDPDSSHDSDSNPDNSHRTGDSDDDSDEDIPHDRSDDEDPPER